MYETYCNVRLFVVTSDGSAIATENRVFYNPPTMDEYEQILFEEISFTDFTCYNWKEIQYIVTVLDWVSPDGAHSAFTMPLNPDDVWPRDFLTDEELG